MFDVINLIRIYRAVRVGWHNARLKITWFTTTYYWWHTSRAGGGGVSRGNSI
jgi:hypothetical protein